ncbi:MAG: hypothetical protein ACP6IP_00095 [Candidatus Njordarchaeia archaeon]
MGNFISFFLGMISKLKRNFPDFYNEAVSSLKKRKVKKYVVFDKGFSFYIVVGDEGEYLVNVSIGSNLKMSCTCFDFFFNILLKSQDANVRGRKICYHLAGVIMSILAEYAFATGSNKLREFRKKSLLPEIILERREYLPIILESIEMD